MAVRRWKPNKIRCRTTLDVVEIGHDMDMGMNMDMEHGVGMWVRGMWVRGCAGTVVVD